MSEPAAFLLWDDVPTEQQAHERPCPTWGTPVTHRGCAAAVAWPDGQGYHRCATRALKVYGLCRRHAQRAGLIPALTPPAPLPIDQRVYNAIRRNVAWGRYVRSVDEFRQLSDYTILDWRNVGYAALPQIQMVRDTWTDEQLAEHFGLRRSYWDTDTGTVACNWVGEGVGA
jgi:hypothetical protein